MVMNTSKNLASPRSKKEAQEQQSKGGKKRAMQDSDSEEDEEDDEITMETLKKISKKMKPSDEVDSEDDDEGSEEDDEDLEGDSEDDEEDDEEDEEDEADEESDEDEKPVTKQAKPQKQQTQSKQAAQSVNGHSKVPEKVTQQSVDGNAVAIFNLDKMVRHENLKAFIESKAGVPCDSCFVSTKTSAVITTKNKQDADKILKACQSVLYQGSQMQVCTIASGIVSQPKPPVLKNLEEIQPAKTMLVYSLTGTPNVDAVKKLVPQATECHKSQSGIFMSFNNLEEAKDAFILLGKTSLIGGVKCMVKYVKNSHVSAVHTGKETRVLLYNLPYGSTKAQVQELVPKATFVHFNPVSWGSWIVEFATPKDCKDAGERLNNYDMGGRPIRASFAPAEGWDIKFNAKSKVNDAEMLFHKQFPDMTNFHVMTVVYKGKRAPAFMLTFKTREAWQRALEKALVLHSIGGVQIYVVNQGKLREDFVKKGGKQPVAPPKIKAKQEPMDQDEDESEDDEAEDDDAADSEEEEKPQAIKNNRGSGSPMKRGRGGAKFGGQQRGGRGGNFRGRGGPQRGRGGNFRGRGK